MPFSPEYSPEQRREKPLQVPGKPDIQITPIAPRRNPEKEGAPWERPNQPVNPDRKEGDPVKIGTPEQPVTEPVPA